MLETVSKITKFLCNAEKKKGWKMYENSKSVVGDRNEPAHIYNESSINESDIFKHASATQFIAYFNRIKFIVEIIDLAKYFSNDVFNFFTPSEGVQ